MNLPILVISIGLQLTTACRELRLKVYRQLHLCRIIQIPDKTSAIPADRQAIASDAGSHQKGRKAGETWTPRSYQINLTRTITRSP
jgi:hypothetical protein